MRSLLFTPANHARRVEKALNESQADAAILDLEDAVAVSEKSSARHMAAEALGMPRQTLAYIRVNGIETPWFFGDLDAVVCPELDGIVLPKTASDRQLYLADRYLGHLERAHGMAPGSVDLLPLIETAEGAANLRQICESGIGRVRRVSFGAADFTGDVGFTWTAGEQELLMVRSQLAIYSRLSGLEAPIDTVHLNVRDSDGFQRSCLRARELGFQGRLCIHPDQAAVANQLFSPTAEEVAWATKVVAAFAAAEASGIAAIQVGGSLVDYPIVRRAEHILASAERLRP